MKKLLPVTRNLMFLVFVALTVFLDFGCGNNSIAEIPKPEVAVRTIGPQTDALKDTSYGTLDELLAYYQPRYIKVSNIEFQAGKEKKPVDSLVSSSPEVLTESSLSIIKERNKAIVKFLLAHEKNKQNFAGFRYLSNSFGVSIQSIDSLFHLFPQTLQNSPDGKYLLEWLNTVKSFAEKNSYNPRILDFTFVNTAGQKTTLKEISSRYILLDFWASWCFPCRQENINLAKLNDILPPPQKFSIVAISLDTNKDKWIRAVKGDQIPYLTVSDLAGIEGSPIAREFKISLIPRNVLISKDGKIIGHDLWEEELIDALNKLP